LLSTDQWPSLAVDATDVTAQMPCVVLRVVVQPGNHVREDNTLIVLEAMKMEVDVSAP
jgi:biotin carboxyl carrier protein